MNVAPSRIAALFVTNQETAMLPIAIGADDAAIELKDLIVAHLQQRDIPVIDYTTDRTSAGHPAVRHRHRYEHRGQ